MAAMPGIVAMSPAAAVPTAIPAMAGVAVFGRTVVMPCFNFFDTSQ